MILIICFQYLNITPIPLQCVSMGLLRENQQCLMTGKRDMSLLKEPT